MSSRILWLPAGGPRATSVTFVPAGQPAWTHLDVQVAWLRDVTAARVYCESYRYVRGDQSGNVVGAFLLSGWIEGLTAATFVLVAEGNGYAAAVAKLASWQ